MIDILGLFGLRATQPMTLALLIGAMVFLVLVGPWIIEARSQNARLRQAIISRHRAQLRAKALHHFRRTEGKSQHSVPNRLARALAILPRNFRADSERLLRSAGYFGSRSTFVFWGVKCGFLIFVGLSVVIDALFLSGNSIENGRLVTWYAFLALGFFMPDVLVRRQRRARLRRLGRSLPDGLDLLVICAEAGLSLDAALKRVADEFIAVVPDLSEELLLTSVELNFLPDRRQALANLGVRVELPAFRGVVATLIQTEKYGTPLAQSLRALASEFREHRLLAAEEKAARLPAILTVPMIVFILPALFIILAAPAFIQVSAKFTSG